ncbi:hypothetical protein DWQ65_08975 [Treponema phagedenis]|uniref:NusG domain II-containing protein n=1 Tax=Treponema phagedenis TaxID=162 RepID=A0A0B7GXF3_TREPH|nr:NusG domain II-containing protein [Treponema phagedenis]NVP24206.1 NusG domain II-containing protein [Treponema phagedenis]QEJ94178.1 NusG domain II-containing protein [Treponema phagedenis]QEJ99235.1 NusG domain II-containing protein [Treponema phagedenis]QEK00137.1 NusG domain II-containing protein [Treponema phagedenis]QEK04802.1 NusG domain II-containing protein [Treponema phagedenis]
MKKFFSSIKIFDVVLLALVLTVVFWVGFFIYGNKEKAPELLIESPNGKWIYSLAENRKIAIPGILGNTEIEIKNGAASVLSSPCTNKTCVARPPLQKHGDWNACMPNQVFLRIEGTYSKAN